MDFKRAVGAFLNELEDCSPYTTLFLGDASSEHFLMEEKTMNVVAKGCFSRVYFAFFFFF